MAKLPGWLRLSKIQRDGDVLRVTVHPRLWHPGLWIALAVAWWNRKREGDTDG